MVDMSQITVEIPIDGKEALIKHIQDLEAVITKRNEEIEALRKENEELIQHPSAFLDLIRNESWRQGWKDCARSISTSVEGLNEIMNRKFER